MKKQAFNPYLPSWEYVPDGEPHLFGDRVCVYGSRDRFGVPMFCVNDYVAWSAAADDFARPGEHLHHGGKQYDLNAVPDRAKKPFESGSLPDRGFFVPGKHISKMYYKIMKMSLSKRHFSVRVLVWLWHQLMQGKRENINNLIFKHKHPQKCTYEMDVQFLKFE